jgi:hypothetical protein
MYVRECGYMIATLAVVVLLRVINLFVWIQVQSSDFYLYQNKVATKQQSMLVSM